MKVQKLNQRQAKWTLYLSRFDFTLEYMPETKIRKADGLSKSNSREIWSRYNIKMKIARSKDKKVVRVVKEIKKAEVRVLKENE